MNLLARRYAISLFYLMVAVVGFAAWRGIPMEMAPDLQLPSVSVHYNWGTTAPEVMEQEVTRRVEQIAYRLRDVQNVRSVTREGRSSVTLEFSKQAPVDHRVIELQELLYTLRDVLPATVRQPVINRQVPRELQDAQTFITYTLDGGLPSRQLLELARQRIQVPLLGIQGISNIELTGAREPALIVEFDPDLVERLNVRPRVVMNQLSQRMRWSTAGFTDEPGGRYSILVPPAYSRPEEIETMAIPVSGSSRHLQLKDIATVSIQDYPARELNRINGNTALTVHFHKEAGADALALAEEIISRMDETAASLPPGITLRLQRDATEKLREQLDELQMQALASLACVFVILILFVRRMRAPLVILGSIVFSLLIAVTGLFLIGYTLNVLTLAGLTVALGMIIDNAVVVFEQINPGMPGDREARLKHVRDLLPRAIVPVLGSTLTTVGIFIPLLFAMEQLRMFLTPLAVALTFTLLASMIVSMTWIPYALIWLLKRDVKSEKSKVKNEKSNVKGESEAGGFWLKFARRDKVQEKNTGNIARNLRHLPFNIALADAHDLRAKAARLYRLCLLFGSHLPFKKIGRWVKSMRLLHARRRLRWIIYPALLFVFGIPTFAIEEPVWEDDSKWREHTRIYFDNRKAIDTWLGGLTKQFFERTYFGTPWGRSTGEVITVTITPPQGSPLDEIDKIARNFEEVAKPYTDALTHFETSVSEYVGARMQFHIKDEWLVKPEPYILFAELSYLAARTGNVRTGVYGLNDSFWSGGGGGGSNFRITLKGYSYDELAQTADLLKWRLERNRRVSNVDVNSSGWGRNNADQFFLTLDQDQAVLKNLSRQDVLDALQLDMYPEYPHGEIDFTGQRMTLYSRVPGLSNFWEDFRNRARISGQTMFSVAELGNLNREPILGTIIRENQAYTRTVAYDFLGPYELGNNFRKQVLESFPFPIGVSVQQDNFFRFEADDQRRNLLFVLLMALLSVWMIVSALLEKWRDPLVVILAVPLSLIGVMAGALFHGINFDQGAIAGTLLCVGVVVNNAILLMHEKERLRRLGINGYRSWVRVYQTKIRTVLITTLTTMGGLVPLVLIGTNDFWNDLAVVVLWGLGGSTVLILLLTGIWEKDTHVKKVSAIRRAFRWFGTKIGKIKIRRRRLA